jgi:hypothetical protein
MSSRSHLASERGKLGGLIRRNAAPDRVEAARNELRSAIIDDHIRRLVDAAPPLSAEQRAKLAVLLDCTPDGGEPGVTA